MVTLVAPVDKIFYNHITQHFNHFNPKKQRIHYGVDFGTASRPNANIYAAAFGKVILMGLSPTYGNMVVIKHLDGSGTLYAHMSKPANYPIGAWVKQKDIIGYAGDTGSPKNVHLHFEVLGLRATAAIERASKDPNNGSDGFIHTGIEGNIDRHDPIPLFSDKTHLFKHFIWKCHGCSCRGCTDRNGEIYEYGMDMEPPLHPNCDCEAISVETSEDNLPEIQRSANTLFDNYLRYGRHDVRLTEFNRHKRRH